MEKLTTIIMAAGRGSRLKHITADIPKALVEIVNKPLIGYAIDFSKKIGSQRIIIVGGFLYEKLEKRVTEIDSEIEIIRNPNYNMGNLYTLDIALDNAQGAVLLANTDHIFHRDIANKIKEQINDKITIFTDNDRELQEDDMKVLTDESGKVLTKISKKIKNYNLGYIGITYCPADLLEDYKKAVKKAMSIYGKASTAEHAMQVMADERSIDVCIGDISGSKWVEVDTVEDLDNAKNIIIPNLKDFI